MIELHEYPHGLTEVWLTTGSGLRSLLITCQPNRMEALVSAEQHIRTALDEVQAQLTAERERLGHVKHSDNRR